MKNRSGWIIGLLFVTHLFALDHAAIAQDDLLSLLEEDESEITYAEAAFKGTRIVNGHSTKLRNKNQLEFLITHRFGPISSGGYELFGLDEANIRLALEYGISDAFEIGLGRSSFEKTYDGFLKWKFLRQKSGAKNSPVSMAWFSSMAVTSLRFEGQDVNFDDRTGYTHQLLIARKFNSAFSFQLNPGFVHLNTVPEIEDDNDILYLGGGFRYKFTPSVALTFEYYYRFNELSSVETYDPIGIGFDIETGGHVFQLVFTNSRPTFEKGFITNTVDNFWDGDIRFGFNISRTFQTGVKKGDW